MKKLFKLLMMLFLAGAGILSAIAAICGAIYREPSVIPGKYWWQTCVYAGALAVGCFIAIKKIYDDWYS